MMLALAGSIIVGTNLLVFRLIKQASSLFFGPSKFSALGSEDLITFE